MNVSEAIQAIEQFQGNSLTASLAEIEGRIAGFYSAHLSKFCASRQIDESFIASALAVKGIAGQINVIIHASGILCALPKLLKDSEVVESVSLGAGNTGRQFDLQTNQRVAEFKFIDWQGGAESIRQNGIFKDFFAFAEHETDKEKYLYVVGTHYPLRFFGGGRALTSVLSKQPDIAEQVREKYGDTVRVVRDYYALHENEVQICDVSPYIGREPSF